MKEPTVTTSTVPQPGMSGSVEATVTDADTAASLGSGDLAVYATPAMVALMEAAACACLGGLVPEGYTTVGTSLAIEHVAASPVGAHVTATATITEVTRRGVTFAVSVRDAVGEIGRGTHARSLVDADTLLARAQLRR